MRTFNKSEQLRIYNPKESVTFRKTKEEFGGLSNMSGGYPLCVNGILIPTAEALYQACRFPHKPEVQELIIDKKSPMTAKMVSKPHRKETRPDWYQIRVRVMRWCLRVKLIMHWLEFSNLLLSTDDKPIVEDSHKDDFWGAKKQDDGTWVGMNVLGRLLMELREELKRPDKELLQVLDSPPIKDFMLLGSPIQRITFMAQEGKQHTDPDLKKEEGTLWSIIKPEDSAKKSFDELEKNQIPAVQVAEQHKDIKDSRMKYPKRLIEVDLPIKRISAHARREKDMRRGHVPLLHIWPATRPPAACRAVLCASLWPDPADELCPDSFREKARELMQQWANKHLKLLSAESYSRFIAYQKDPDKLKNNEELRKALLDFIADFANWDNSTVKEYLEASRQLTQTAHEALGGQPGTKPLVVDPFAGAGAIPLEALRIGADSFASELNPVAVLLNKVVIEYIPKYGRRLSNEVRRWGNWVKEETEKELAEFYPKDPDGAIPVAYLWARTILCEGPSCGCEVPLIRSLWLARKRKQPIALKLIHKPKEKCIDLEIANGVKPKEIGAGTIRRGAATCPCCGYTTPIESVRKQLRANRGGAANARMLCVATIRPDIKGRFYRLPSANDLAAVEKAKVEIESRDTKSSAPLSLIPREPTPEGGGRGAGRAFGQRNYGMDSYDTAFTPRQLLVLTTIVQLTKKYCNSIAEEFSNEFIEAVRTIIGLVVDKMVDMNSALCVWQTHAEIPAHVFGRWAWPTIWDFAEANPLAGSSGSFETACKRTIDGIDHLAKGRYVAGHSASADAASHPLPDDCAMMFATDPPYYDAIPYGDISDFFYVWLKRLLYDSHAGLFKNVLSEKENECIVDDARGKDRNFFLDRMTKAMEEGRRILAPDGIGFVVFAHKSTVGWEAQLRSMIDAGWIITSSWPIDTEMRSRLRAKNSAALASSIHLICRPRENPDGSVITNYVGDWRDVLAELPNRIHEWMPRLAEEGVVGADAIFACLGPALEVFSRYSKVEKASGEEVTLREYLEHVWAAVAKEALNMIFAGADAAGFEEDSRLTAMWLWTLSTGANGNGQKETADEKTTKSVGYTLEFDAARKIAQGLGAHLEKLGRMVEIKGDKARLLSVAERTKYLFGKDESQAPVGRRKKKDSQMQLDFMAEVQKAEREEGGWGEKNTPRAGETVLDQLHQTMILFAAGRGEAMKRFLVEEGIGRDGRFWRLAQAFSALYPSGTDEKRWVDGVLARKKSLGF